MEPGTRSDESGGTVGAAEGETVSETEQETQPQDEPVDAEPDEEEQADEEGDAETEHEGEPEPEAVAAPAGISAEELEKRFKAIERAWKTYTGKVSSIMEEEALQLTECPLCSGTVPGFVLIDGAGHVDDVTKSVVQTYMGIVQEADYPSDPDFRECNRCDGLGQIRTGSKVPQWKMLTCQTCSGRGYLGPPVAAANGVAEPSAVLAAVGAPVAAEPPAEADAFGSPRLLPDGMENPNYGRMPQYKDPRWP